MDLSLNRHDYMQVSSTAKKSVRILPLGKKKTQKVVVGDVSGVITCFGVKKNECQNVFKTLPSDPVARIELGGLKSNKDKIFIASGNSIKALNKKGKEFFRFNVPLNEKIGSFFTEDNKLWIGGDYTYNHFVDCKDKNFYMANDRIFDMGCAPVTNPSSGEYDVILGCKDRNIRVVTGSELTYETTVESGVHVVEINTKTPDQAAAETTVLYGTDNGVVGALIAQKQSAKREWVIPNMRKLGGISSLGTSDITKDGIDDVLVGRDDGNMEVYCFDVSPDPQPVFEKSVSESITSLESGLVYNPGYDEIILSTFSGKIISFSAEDGRNEHVITQMTQKGVQKITAKDKKVTALRAELEELRKKVDKEKFKYGQVSHELVSTTQQFRMNDKWILNPEDASYTCQVEIEMPIDMVCLRCDVNADILDVDSNLAIVSRSPPDRENENGLLATYRCLENVNRLEMRLRTIEGQYGTLTVYVIPKLTPKTCQSLTYPIRPLSLHQRVTSIDDLDNRPLNEIRLSGQFHIGEMHAWVGQCLPGIPPKVQADDMQMFFKSTFLGTVLSCQYKKNEGVFRSDSITTIAIMKEVITKAATASKKQLQIKFDIKEESIPHYLQIIHPLITYQLTLAKKFRVMEALKEIKMHEQDISFLNADFVDTLDNQEMIEKEFKLQPRKVEVLHSLIIDFYIDRFKFKNMDVSGRVPKLQQLIWNYDLDSIVRFFKET
eukprot:GFYU01007326.1.p1 GENE.GFYU01007326.1~~GFYU01007326.1.p1  ORF type:complete len:720 (+),score=217.69 GFYU01007326.1:110-2269(+)